MPTASTAQILGNYECFEPILSNIYTRRVLSGEYMVLNDYLVEDLISLGLWSSELKDKIIANDGSVLNIPEIPDDKPLLFLVENNYIIYSLNLIKNLILMKIDVPIMLISSFTSKTEIILLDEMLYKSVHKIS